MPSEDNDMRFRLLAENASDMIYRIRLHPTLQCEYINPAVTEIMGYTPEDYYAEPSLIYTTLHPEDAQVLQPLINHPSSEPLTVRYVRKDGSTIWVTQQQVPILDAAGTLIAIEGIHCSITHAHSDAEHQHMRAALHESEERFRQLTDNLREVFWMTNAQGTEVLYISPAYEDLWGQSISDLYENPLSWQDSIVPDDRNQIAAFWSTLPQDRFELQYQVIKPDGTRRWISDRGFALYNETGEIYRMGGISEDITDRKNLEIALRRLNEELEQRVKQRTAELEAANGQLQVENMERQQVELALRESETTFRQLAETIQSVFWITNLDFSQRIYVSPAYETIWGRSCADVYRQPLAWIDAIHPDDRDRILTAIPGQAQGKYHVEYRIIRPDGEIRWIVDRAFVVADEQTIPYRIVGIAEDITDRKLAEQALQESQYLTQSIAEATPNILFIYDLLDQRNIYTNRSVTEILGYSSQKLRLMGKTVLPDLLHPDDLPRVEEHQRDLAVLQSNHVLELEVRVRDIKGDWHWISTRNTVFTRAADGTVKQILGVAQDITQRKQAEASLLKSEADLAEAQRIAHLGSWEFDPATAKITWSAETFRIFGFDTNQSAPTYAALNHLFHPDERLSWHEAIATTIQQKQPYEMEHRIIRADGSNGYILARGQPILNPEGEVVRLFGTVLDITALKQAEEKIRASLLEKDTLLKEVHHRVKNNLQIVSSLLRLQSRQIDNEAALTLFQESQNRVQAMALIHEQLYQSEHLSQINAQRYITTLVENLSRSYGGSKGLVTINICIEQGALPIDTAIPCGLIINELVSNALKHAFPDQRQGTISIVLSSATHDADGLEQLCEQPGNSYSLTVSDDGIGFPQHLDLHQTKSLGLMLVGRLVQQIQGTIALDGNAGSTFKVSFVLPKAESAAM